jgi:hypothetical protein
MPVVTIERVHRSLDQLVDRPVLEVLDLHPPGDTEARLEVVPVLQRGVHAGLERRVRDGEAHPVVAG